MRYQKDTNTYSKTQERNGQQHTDRENDYIPESQYFSFIVSRTEKLASAVYMVTNLITDTEPLKRTLRERSIDFLSYISGSRTYAVSERMAGVTKCADAISEMISLLHVARAGNLISEMNYQVLQEEYAALQTFIENTPTVQTEAEDFVETLFAHRESPELHAGTNQKDIYKGHDNHKNVLYNLTHTYTTPQQTSETATRLKKTHPGSPQTARAATSASPERKTKQANEIVKQERRSTIINLVKRHGTVTIKDVVEHISGCSEKTVQRELLGLVKDNVLTKEGEKRWSKYRLKDKSK